MNVVGKVSKLYVLPWLPLQIISGKEDYLESVPKLNVQNNDLILLVFIVCKCLSQTHIWGIRNVEH